MDELIDEKEVFSRGELQGYPVIHNRLEGALHPGKMMEHLAQKVGKTGIEIKWNSEVEKVNREGEVTLASGSEIEANRILFAANGFVRRFLPNLNIKPARGLIFVTNELDDLPWKGIFHHDRGYIYFRNIGKRLLIGGARNIDKDKEETDQFGTNSKIKRHLVSFVSDVLKLPADWHIDYEWSGIMGFSPTKTPVIQQVDEKQYVAAGLSGMGIAIGMEVGRSAAEML